MRERIMYLEKEIDEIFEINLVDRYLFEVELNKLLREYDQLLGIEA